jgi:hypothetical protein
MEPVHKGGRILTLPEIHAGLLRNDAIVRLDAERDRLTLE